METNEEVLKEVLEYFENASKMTISNKIEMEFILKKALAIKDEENKKKLTIGNEESRRSALSNYLATEGQQTGRRRFLVGAK